MDGIWRRHSNLPDVAERHIATDNGWARQKVQDVAPTIEGNRRIRNETGGRTQGGGELVGRVPATVYYDWVKEWTAKGLIGPGHMDALNDLLIERLADSDFSKFRTADGGI